MISAENRRTAQFVLKETVRSHTAIKKWLDWCDGLSAAKKEAGLYRADLHREDYERWIALSIQVEKAYLASHKKPPMPSKERKLRMYDSTYRVAALVGLEVPAGSLNSLEDVFRTLTAVTVALAIY